MADKIEQDRFKIRLDGLSEDMESFICERAIEIGAQTEFWHSFWRNCWKRIENLQDLSEKQLAIVWQEYEKYRKQSM